MPLSFKPTGDPRLYLPQYIPGANAKQKSEYAAVTRLYEQGYARLDQGAITPPAQPEQTKQPGALTYNPKGSRFEVGVIGAIHEGVKHPAYAFEAPLRPLDMITGGALSKALDDSFLSSAGSKGVSILQDLSNIGFGVLVNSQLASKWKEAQGKPDSYVLQGRPAELGISRITGKESDTLTAGEVRKKIKELWVDTPDVSGNMHTQAEIESRMNEFFGEYRMGEFQSSADQTSQMIGRMLADPLNLILMGGGGLAASGIKAGAKWLALSDNATAGAIRALYANSWARPVVRWGATRPAWGRGAMEALDRGVVNSKGGRAFLDVQSAAGRSLAGELAKHGTLESTVQALSWGLRGMGRLAGGAGKVGQKVYFPGLKVAAGEKGRTIALTKAWMRGGFQQEIVENAGSFLAGQVDEWTSGDSLGNEAGSGFAAWTHDMLNDLNNRHPLSQNDAFVLTSMFLPWHPAVAEMVGTPGRALRARTAKDFSDKSLYQVKEQLYSKGYKGTGPKGRMTYDEIVDAFGKGVTPGKDVIEYMFDTGAVVMAQNQFSHMTQAIISLEALASRIPLVNKIARADVISRRASGAMQPKSATEYLWKLFEEGPRGAEGIEQANALTGTAQGFIDFWHDAYRVNQNLAPQLSKMYDITVVQGAPITQEIIAALRREVESLPEGSIIPRELAEKLNAYTKVPGGPVDPSLIWDPDFWGRLGNTLGQKQIGGVFKRGAQKAEDVTRETLLEQMDSLSSIAPSEAVLNHESIIASSKVAKPKRGILDMSEAPYKVGRRIAEVRSEHIGRAKQLKGIAAAIQQIRDLEFFKNGKSRYATVKQLSGHGGGLFDRVEGTPIFKRADGTQFEIKNGQVEIGIGSRESELVSESKATIFKSGPREGEIKPGMEAEHQRLNLAIEAQRAGIDPEALTLAIEQGGRLITASTKAGPTLAHHGFAEVARVEGKDVASYSYRGGDPSKLLANQDAGVFSSYRPSRRVVGSEAVAVKLARNDAARASLYDPSMDGLGTLSPSGSSTWRSIDPEARRNHLKEVLNRSTEAYKHEVADVSRIDEVAQSALPFTFLDTPLRDMFEEAGLRETTALVDSLKTMRADFPSLTLAKTSRIFVDPRESRIAHLAAVRSEYRRLAFDYGFLSPVNRIYDALFSPINSKWLAAEANREVRVQLSQQGVSSKQAGQFIAGLQKIVADSRMAWLPGDVGLHKIREIRAIPEREISAVAMEAFPDRVAGVLDRWGSFSKMFTESGNRLLRSSAKKVRAGGELSELEAAATGFMWTWEQGMTKGVSSLAQRAVKFYYPLLRFNWDPFYWVMNYLEPDVYGFINEGRRASRMTKVANPEQSEMALRVNSARNIPPGGIEATATPEYAFLDPGVFTYAHNIKPIIERHFDVARPESTLDFLRALKKEDPFSIAMTERFGDNIKDWAKETDRMMYGWSKGGPEEFATSSFKELIDEMGYTKEEVRSFIPVIERVQEVHRGIYNDMVNLYVGRLSRPNIERLANNYFFIWPISYTIKASTWLYRALFKRIGGINGSVGAYAFDEYRQRFENYSKTNPGFKNYLEDHREMMFVMEMMFPISPMGVGGSISRPTRFVGSWLGQVGGSNGPLKGLQDIFPPDPKVSPGNIPELIGGAAQVGPIRTYKALGELWSELELPGFYDPPPPKSLH